MQENTDVSMVPWKKYLTLTAESLLAFYIATFCLIMFFSHRGFDWLITSIFLVLLYLFVLFACAKRVFKKVSLPAMMIIVPIAPLIALILVVSLIPLIEFLH